jgi:hypothetical protein
LSITFRLNLRLLVNLKREAAAYWAFADSGWAAGTFFLSQLLLED